MADEEKIRRLGSRYDRQVLLPDIGPDGQRRIQDSIAMVVGCGALGTGILNHLARAGIGRLIIIDRDVVEPSNLQRQSLFDERDAIEGRSKAGAAAERIAAINRDIEVVAIDEDLGPGNFASGGAYRADSWNATIVPMMRDIVSAVILTCAAMASATRWWYSIASGSHSSMRS